MPWVGDLAELVYNNWMKNRGVTGYNWLVDDPLDNPDFVMASGMRVDVKAVKRAGEPRARYGAQIPAKHRDKPYDELCFMSYDIGRKTMWIVGGIERRRFLELARFYKKGEQVHEHYTAQCDIYNVEIERLVSPEPWLASVK